MIANIAKNRILNLLPEIREYRISHSIKETKERYKISSASLKNFAIFGPQTIKRLSCPDALTEEQKECIFGNLLGDGCIPVTKVGGRNNHFCIMQKSDKKEYLDWLFAIYSPFSSGIHTRQNRKPCRIDGKINHDIENWAGEYTESSQLYTVAHPVFNELRNQWYKYPDTTRSPKIVPRDLRLTWRMAAIWMCDDGTNNLKRRTLSLYTDSFSCEDAEFLVERIAADLGVRAGIYLRSGKPVIKICGDECFNFIEGIKPFMQWECFSYKAVNRKALSLKSKVDQTSGLANIRLMPSGRWVTYISIGGQKRKCVGTFDTKEQAFEAQTEAYARRAMLDGAEDIIPCHSTRTKGTSWTHSYSSAALAATTIGENNSLKTSLRSVSSRTAYSTRS